MANKVRFYHLWDKKEVLGNLMFWILIITLFIIIFNFYKITEHFKLTTYDSETVGTLITTDIKTGMRQSLEGNKTEVNHILIQYEYKVGTMEFTQTDRVAPTQENLESLDRIINDPDKKVYVKYRFTEPQKSAINLKKTPPTDSTM